MKKLLFVLIFVSSFLTGCAIGPNYLRPSITAPEAYRGQVGVPEATSLSDLPWWEVFHDDVLKGLIEEALKNNYDLRTCLLYTSPSPRD